MNLENKIKHIEKEQSYNMKLRDKYSALMGKFYDDTTCLPTYQYNSNGEDYIIDVLIFIKCIELRISSLKKYLNTLHNDFLELKFENKFHLRFSLSKKIEKAEKSYVYYNIKLLEQKHNIKFLELNEDLKDTYNQLGEQIKLGKIEGLKIIEKNITSKDLLNIIKGYLN